jgi:hypothetical protein
MRKQLPHSPTRLSPGASQHQVTKPDVSGGRVDAAVVRRGLMFLFGEIQRSRSAVRRLRRVRCSG